VALLRVRVRALEKYKANYELLCGQLGELNAQIGLQLQRHESDVETLQATIDELQHAKLELEAQVASQQELVKQDREYSQRVHRQLSTAAQLLKATEKRVESKEQQLLGEVEDTREQLEQSREQVAELQAANAALEARASADTQRYQQQVEREASKHAAARERLKSQLAAANARCKTLSEQLKQQRAAHRDVKKLAVHAQSENEALRRQLSSAQQDAEHLGTILDSQRAEQDEGKQALATMRRANKKLELKLTTATCELEGLRVDVLAVQEQLVAKNTALAASQSDLKAARTELQQRSNALENALKHCEALQHEAQSRGDKEVKADASKQQADKYQREVRKMRQLLVLNAQRAADSSKDVKTLKHELEHVQRLLLDSRATPSQPTQVIHTVAAKSREITQPYRCREEEDDGEMDESNDSWCDLLLTDGKAEESVLKSAIMEQVRAFAA